MFRSLMVPFEGSKPAWNALEIACDLARRYDAGVNLVHVVLRTDSVETLTALAKENGFFKQIEPDLNHAVETVVPAGPSAPVMPITIIPDETLNKIGELIAERATSHASQRGFDNIDIDLLDGDPAHEILNLAEARGTDLIVAGSRGFGAVKSLLLGSVSRKLVEDAGCPVLVVK